MTTLHPFSPSRESILYIWSQTNQAKRALPEAKASELFVLLQGMIYTKVDLDDFRPTLSRFIERLELEGAEDREWIMMATVNIASVLEYGKPNGFFKRLGGVGGRDPSTAATAMRLAKREAADDRMDVDGSAAPPSRSSSDEDDISVPLKFALQLSFSMLSYVLRHPTRKSSQYARSTVNPYLTVFLTFLSTILKNPASKDVLERLVSWDELGAFLSSIPRAVMHSQRLDQPVPADAKRWDMVTSGCAPPLPEDWCLRGMEWVGRKVFERGYWRSGLDRKLEQEVLDEAEQEDMTDGQIEDDSEDEGGEQSTLGKRWVRIARSAVEISSVVDGFVWAQGTREWRVEGALREKVEAWSEEDRLEREEEERRRRGSRWVDVDDSMDVDEDYDMVASESSDEEEPESPEITALKVSLGIFLFVRVAHHLQERRRYLENLIQDSEAMKTPTAHRRTRRRKAATDNRAMLSIQPGYTVLVVDTNILLSSLSIFSSLVEGHRWTIVVPLPVVMELDGITRDEGALGVAAKNALALLTSYIRTHSISFKVQTSKGNYLQNLNIRTEEIDFSAGSAERNMDDLILKAAIWHEEHWVDRSGFLQANAMPLSNPVKVVLLSLDRNRALSLRVAGTLLLILSQCA